jgi:hypothetical protein
MLVNSLLGIVAVRIVVTAVLATMLIEGGWLTWIAVLAYFGTAAWLCGGRALLV